MEEVRQAVVADTVVKAKGGSSSGANGSIDFVKIGDKLVLVDELDIDMIESINPFQDAYEVISHDLGKEAFKQIQDYISSTRINVTDEECARMLPYIKNFIATHKREPSKTSNDPLEARMYECLVYFRIQKAKKDAS